MYRVYFRNEDMSLGRVDVSDCESHEVAILEAKEYLVANGDGLQNKAVLVALKGGKE